MVLLGVRDDEGVERFDLVDPHVRRFVDEILREAHGGSAPHVDVGHPRLPRGRPRDGGPGGHRHDAPHARAHEPRAVGPPVLEHVDGAGDVRLETAVAPSLHDVNPALDEHTPDLRAGRSPLRRDPPEELVEALPHFAEGPRRKRVRDSASRSQARKDALVGDPRHETVPCR